MVKSGRMANSPPPCATGACTSSPIQMTSAATARKKTWKNLAAPSHWHMPPQKSVGVLSSSSVSTRGDGRARRARARDGLRGERSKKASPQQQDHRPDGEQDFRARSREHIGSRRCRWNMAASISRRAAATTLGWTRWMRRKGMKPMTSEAKMSRT